MTDASASGEPAIPYLDLVRRTQRHAPVLEAGARRVLRSGRLLDGPEVAAFENEWAQACDRARAVAVGSGTDALRLALLGLGIGAGNEVIMPAFTAIPTAAAVCATGAIPVFADVERETATLDPESARAALTPRTAAVVIVHLYGRPAPLPRLGVPVIEDCAHAHGMRSDERGVAAAYSFYPTKNLGGIGDGGAVVTDDLELAERVVRLRSHGRGGDGLHRDVATNSRMSEIEAAALVAMMPELAADNGRRRLIAGRYREAAPELGWQASHPEHVHHLCVARFADRDRLRSRFPFGTGIHYPRAIVDEPAYARFERDPVPRAREWAASCVSMPCYPELTEAELDAVVAGLQGMAQARMNPSK
jgi:dTDP-4-amino-4,6-dideoxygalactose transaminase